MVLILNASRNAKTRLRAYEGSVGPDQPARLCSLIRAFVKRIIGYYRMYERAKARMIVCTYSGSSEYVNFAHARSNVVNRCAPNDAVSA